MEKYDARLFNDMLDRWKIDDPKAEPESLPLYYPTSPVSTFATAARDDIIFLVKLINAYESLTEKMEDPERGKP